jgi:uncharacterized protein YdbL (DUF1318 family)
MATRKLGQKAGGALTVAITIALLSGCKAPTINLSTNDPIKVDIAMRLDVYQHNPPAAESTTTKPVAIKPDGSEAERRKNRAADIQVFKNSRLVGEGHDGLLVILTQPAGDYGGYVRRAVADENSDRLAQMKVQATAQHRPLPDIQKEQAALWANRSFKGEWIEVRQPDGAYQWAQKQG